MAPNGGNTITFTEVDELNNPASTLIYSEVQSGHSVKDGLGNEIKGRVDLAHAPSVSTLWSMKSIQNLLTDVFLPAGYPHSVSEDYVSYQIFDSLQAFSSSIAGLLSSRAVLQGVGVGNADASPTSALLLHILQDTSGRIATILFAHRVGTALEPECKMYRFAADIFNDLAMVLDCLSPMIPAGVGRVTVLSAAGVLRALCGVAGGSSKASLSAHFARWGNLAEVNAKDSSQETVISLVGMLVGSLVVSHITSFTATWLTLLALLTLHLSLNYTAVRSVQMRTLNRQRANIVFSYMLSSDPDVALLTSGQLLDQRNYAEPADRNQKHLQIPSPAQVSRRERIFEASGTLKWYPCSLREQEERPAKPEILGSCQIGVSPRKFLSSPSSISTSHGSLTTSLPVAALTSLFNNEDYILIFTPMALCPMLKPTAKILLKQNATPKTHLKAWMHALLAARLLARSYSTPAPSKQDGKKRDESFAETETALSLLERALRFLNESSRFEGYIGALGDKGWEVDVEGGGVSALETRVGRRVVVS
ncbi:vitamin B6 photo-protection and homoeostasis-domain-containing protein [Aspergillus pseudodeflectus]|uniref:Vitamin B6 photo-protection and homoeostasis-domain-containing protein n=1 Tax=Aspergillus pseudodeflectus TaxID=176178 RepID=A0ABR4L2A0_9EURO